MKKISLFLSLGIILCIVGCYPPDSAIQKGVDFLEKGKNEAGIAYFEKMHIQYDLPLTEYLLGYAFYRNNEIKESISRIYHSLKKKSFKDRYIGDRKFAEFLAFNSNGSKGLLFTAGLNELERYRKAKGLKNNNEEILSSYAFFYLKQHEYETAISYFRTLTEITKDDEEKISNLFFIAYIYEEKIKNFSKAEETLDEVLSHKKNNLAYQRKIIIFEKNIEKILKKEELLFKYFKNLEKLNKGKEDIALALKEIEKNLFKVEIIFVKLTGLTERIQENRNKFINNTTMTSLRDRTDRFQKQYTLISTKL